MCCICLCLLQPLVNVADCSQVPLENMLGFFSSLLCEAYNSTLMKPLGELQAYLYLHLYANFSVRQLFM